MPKLTLLFAVLLLASCSAKPENKVSDEIRSYMQKNLNDFDSYQPVETSNPQSLDYSFKDTYEGKVSEAMLSTLPETSGKPDPTDLLASLTEDDKRMRDSLSDLLNKSRHFYGWQVFHKYRAKNSFGATILKQDTFYFDKQYNLVLKDTIHF